MSKKTSKTTMKNIKSLSLPKAKAKVSEPKQNKKDTKVQNKKLVKITANTKTKIGKSDISLNKLVNTGLSIADTIVTTMENPVDGLMNKLPNSILKVADMLNDTNKPLVPNAKETFKPQISGQIVSGSKEEKFITGLKEQIPVVTITQLPSSHSADYTPAPLTIKDVVYGKTPCIRINGSVIIEPLQMAGTPILWRNRTGFLNPATTNLGTILSTTANMYQRHLWLNCALFYIPQCPTTFEGNVILSWQNSPNNTYTPTTSITELSQRSSFVQGHINKGLTLPLKGEHKQLYNWFYGTSSDIKFYSDWSYEWWTIGSPFTSPATTVGYIGMTFDLLLFSRIESPLIGLMSFPRQSINYISCSTGISYDKVVNILGDMVEMINHHRSNSLKIDDKYNTTIQLPFQKFALKRAIPSKESFILAMVEILGWEKFNSAEVRYSGGHPLIRLLEIIHEIIVFRQYDLVLLSNTDKSLDLFSTLLIYILNNHSDDFDPFLDEVDNLCVY